MKLYKPKFWNFKNNLITVFLLPISFIVEGFNYLKKKLSYINTFRIPIICVGNIYVGGTGKTPTSILLANELTKKGKKPAIIRKFYKSHHDEYNLITKYFKNLITNKDRVSAINNAIQIGCDSVILDDGYQDYKIKKNLNIICFNLKQKIGNGYVLPAGPLRENLSSLINAHVIILNGKKDKIFEKYILRYNNKLSIFYSKYIPEKISQLRKKKIYAFAGIGDPQNFFDMLENNNVIIVKKKIFPDHYQFNKNEISKIINIAKKNKLKIVTTEKDYNRIKKFNFKEIMYVKIKLKIEGKDKFMKKILKEYD
tara:strand:- start:642 stop:1574 length:933 start_codon:yes stop_codon:yes gene_type:complete